MAGIVPVPRLGRVCGHTFVESWIGRNPTVVDLGMNRGEFAEHISSRFPRVRVYGCEPVPALFERLKTNFADRVLNVAVGGRTQRAQIAIYKKLCASAVFFSWEPDAQSVPVQMLSLDDFVALFGLSRIDLLKVDIEGAELQMLLQTSETVLTNCDQISVEFHDFMDPDQIDDVHMAISRIRSLGFKSFRCSILNHSDMLFVNERLCTNRTVALLIWARVIRNYFTGKKFRNFLAYTAAKARSRRPAHIAHG
jgi:FkbM family methyltransferase